MKVLVTLLSATLALTACASVTAPEDQATDAQAAAAKRRLEAATKDPGPSLRLAAN